MIIQKFSKYASTKREYSATGQQQQIGSFGSAVGRWVRGGINEAPPYAADSRERDKWLQVWRYANSHITSVINQVCLLYANRGWSLTGGRNQVRKYTGRLHDCANGKGWRHMIKVTALSFLTSDINSVLETIRERDITFDREGNGHIAPMVRLNPLDPTKCRLTRQLAPLPNYPKKEWWSTLEYNGIQLFDWDYVRTASMPNDMETFNGLGYCALSRAVDTVKLLFYLYQHDSEELDSEMPDGLLILDNISEKQWRQVMQARREELTAKRKPGYRGLEVLAGGGQFGSADAKLIALSQLPQQFDRKTFIDSCMYAIAAAFGMDAAEFWPVNSGVIGRVNETHLQHEKTSAKGLEDFPLSFQESLQLELPETVHFEFQERDDTGEKALLETLKLSQEIISEMSKVTVENNIPVLTRQEIRQLWAEKGLIPKEWTEEEEAQQSTDEIEVRLLKEHFLSLPAVRRSCEHNFNEPIIQYKFNGVKQPTEILLWSSGQEALQRSSYQLNKYLIPNVEFNKILT